MKFKYSAFGKTKMVEAKIYFNNKLVKDIYSHYSVTLWVERGEDMYALMSPFYRDKRVLVVDRNDWLKGVEIANAN